MSSPCFLQISLSCAVLCQIVSRQYLCRSSLYNHVLIYLTIMYPYVVDTCDYSKYTDVWKNWLVIDNHTHTGNMTVVSCPLCDYETDDVSDTIAAVLLSTHAISHQHGATASSAKVERVSRYGHSPLAPAVRPGLASSLRIVRSVAQLWISLTP